MSDGDEIDEKVLEGLPGGVTQSWGIVKKPRRGPKGELSVDQIVEAAIGIADKEGLAAVSMSRVAQTFGFTTMSLYRYIRSKSDLLLLMQDRVCDIERPVDEAADWREEMRQYVRTCVEVFRKHQWYVEIPIQGIPLTPHMLGWIDWTLGIMKDFPLNDFEKMSFSLLLNSYARACGMIERDIYLATRSGGGMDAFNGTSYTAALKTLVDKERFPHLHPLLMSGAYTGETESPIGDDLEFGLERILDGIEQYVQARMQGPARS